MICWSQSGSAVRVNEAVQELDQVVQQNAAAAEEIGFPVAVEALCDWLVEGREPDGPPPASATGGRAIKLPVYG